MADKSGIAWTDATWNPVVGCSVISPACTNCYAMAQAARIERMSAGAGRATHYAGTTQPSKAGPVKLTYGDFRRAREALKGGNADA